MGKGVITPTSRSASYRPTIRSVDVLLFFYLKRSKSNQTVRAGKAELGRGTDAAGSDLLVSRRTAYEQAPHREQSWGCHAGLPPRLGPAQPLARSPRVPWRRARLSGDIISGSISSFARGRVS